MLKLGDLSKAPEVTTNYKFPLDPFQKIAIKSIQDEENVMVTAKTGSGKTLVAEYQIEYSLSKGKRVFYTTPIKSLSNQKFHDLKEIHGSRVGIMTGDIKFAPQSDIVILTTEILRNLLFKMGTSTENIGTTAMLSLENVDAVVFDEFHYIMDPERGKVWEETLILLPAHIKVILLSATIDSPELFGEWLARLKGRNLMLVSTQYRVVPLKHGVYCGDTFEIFMDNSNVFYKDAYNRYLTHEKNQNDNKRKQVDKVQSRRAGGYEDPVVAKENTGKSFVFQMNKTIEKLKSSNLLPALFFVFSRRQCEEYALKVEDHLLTHEESASVRQILGFHLSRYGTELQTTKQYQVILQLLQKGIAYHHSGLLPLLKEIVELLFSKGLVRILFATETFAVGINMPTKTVVFTSFQKHDDEGLRMLRTDEYIQMAGRAGRRGKDTEGIVMYLPDRRPEALENVQKMATGKQQSLCSRLDFHYDFLIKSLLLNRSWISIQDSSYWNCLRKLEIEEIEQEIKKLSVRPDIPFADLEERDMYEGLMKTTTNAARKDAQRKLEQWKNKRQSPVWDNYWKSYKNYKQNEVLVNKMKHDIEKQMSNKNCFLDYLETMGFVKDDKLTSLGILASEINEGHPLLLSKMYQDSHLNSLTREELVSYFACFIEEDEEPPLNVVPAIKTAINKTEELARAFEKIDEKSPARYWKIHSYWSEVVYRWMHGEELPVLCSEYEIYEGNLTKALLKISNIADEYVNMATITRDFETLEKLRDIRQSIVRGIVVPDSLYLRV
ncbi:DEAD/DEAH box helicase [bacterium]|nr:DEAD/DEAH box helicase [Actinomycetota bacterium]NDG29245.1 DEAD/DEAH box helicase [bacterium]